MIPESPLSFEGMMSTLTEEQLDAELEKGYADIAAGRTYEAKSVFDSIRRDYDYSTSFIASVARTSPFWRCCKEKIFPCVFASIVWQKMPRFRPLYGRYCTAILRLNQLRIRGIIQRDQCRFSKSLFLLTGNPTAVIVPPSAALSAVPRSRPAALSTRQHRHRRNARCC